MNAVRSTRYITEAGNLFGVHNVVYMWHLPRHWNTNPRTGRGYHDYGKVSNDPNRPGLVDPYDLASIIANIATPVVEYMLHDEDVPKSGGFFAPPSADLLEYYEISAPDGYCFNNMDPS